MLHTKTLFSVQHATLKSWVEPGDEARSGCAFECTVMTCLLSVGVVAPPISEPTSAHSQPEQVQRENESELVTSGFPDKQVKPAEQEVSEREGNEDTKLLCPDQLSTESEDQGQLKLEGDEQAMDTSTSAPNIGGEYLISSSLPYSLS